MHVVELAHPSDFDGWRTNARRLAQYWVQFDRIIWRLPDEPKDMFEPDPPLSPWARRGPQTSRPRQNLTVPQRFMDLAEVVVAHREPRRWSLLYAALMRILDDRNIAYDDADPLMAKLHEMAKSVKRDIHKMRAFVRFKNLGPPGEEQFVAWFEPEHFIVRPNSGFFQRRFTPMKWSILTPDECVHWDLEQLSFTPGATWIDLLEGDELEETWKTYYAATFNPARVKVKAMLREMPKKYWRNMPETALVPELIAGAQAREQGMIDRSAEQAVEEAATGVAAECFEPGGTARSTHPVEPLDFTPVAALPIDRADTVQALAEVAELARGCTRCELYGPATQTVFGEGPADATIMFVGEQPGDQEDLVGHPFVGPAGQLFDRALAQAGVNRSTTYVTNAVKHFKFELRGKRRIHSKPGSGEIEACRWWIEQERKLIRPRVTVALGATAARSLMGRAVTISRERGRAHTLADGGECWITVHPSFLLRVEDKTLAEAEFKRFVEDLRTVGTRAAELA